MPRTLTQRLEDATTLAESASGKMANFIDGPETETIPSKTGPIPTLKKWLFDLKNQASGLVGVVQAQVDELLPANSASFVYTDGQLSQMTEELVGGPRVTSYQYESGQLTSAVEIYKNRTRTTTYNYGADGELTSITKEDVFS